jgi:hypothetical protein
VLCLPGSLFLRDDDLIPCSVTTASPFSPSTFLPPTPPSPRACGTAVAASRMRASVKMRFWLQFLGLIICRRHLVLRVTSLAETANIYLLHTAECGGRAHGSKWRRRLKLSYRYKARFPTGSMQPRRGRGRSETLPYVSRIATIVHFTRT